MSGAYAGDDVRITKAALRQYKDTIDYYSQQLKDPSLSADQKDAARRRLDDAIKHYEYLSAILPPEIAEMKAALAAQKEDDEAKANEAAREREEAAWRAANLPNNHYDAPTLTCADANGCTGGFDKGGLWPGSRAGKIGHISDKDKNPNQTPAAVEKHAHGLLVFAAGGVMGANAAIHLGRAAQVLPIAGVSAFGLALVYHMVASYRSRSAAAASVDPTEKAQGRALLSLGSAMHSLAYDFLSPLLGDTTADWLVSVVPSGLLLSLFTMLAYVGFDIARNGPAGVLDAWPRALGAGIGALLISNFLECVSTPRDATSGILRCMLQNTFASVGLSDLGSAFGDHTYVLAGLGAAAAVLAINLPRSGFTSGSIIGALLTGLAAMIGLIVYHCVQGGQGDVISCVLGELLGAIIAFVKAILCSIPGLNIVCDTIKEAGEAGAKCLAAGAQNGSGFMGAIKADGVMKSTALNSVLDRVGLGLKKEDLPWNQVCGN